MLASAVSVLILAALLVSRLIAQGNVLEIKDLLPGDRLTVPLIKLLPKLPQGESLFMLKDPNWPSNLKLIYPKRQGRCVGQQNLKRALGFFDSHSRQAYLWSVYFEGQRGQIVWGKGSGKSQDSSPIIETGVYEIDRLRCKDILIVGYLKDDQISDRLYCLQET